MATLAAVNSVGDSIVTLLRNRRDLLAAEGKLGPVPATTAVTHLSMSGLVTGPEPTTGMTLSCYRIASSDHPAPRSPDRDASGGTTISIELRYLLAAWAATPIEEQSILTWAMLELASYPVLDRSLLLGDAWLREETVQLVHDPIDDDALFRLWEGLKHKYRLSTVFRARVLRIGYGPGETWPPVVATRFGFADADPVMEASA